MLTWNSENIYNSTSSETILLCTTIDVVPTLNYMCYCSKRLYLSGESGINYSYILFCYVLASCQYLCDYDPKAIYVRRECDTSGKDFRCHISPAENKKNHTYSFFNHGTNLESLVFKGNAGQLITKQRKRKAMKRTS